MANKATIGTGALVGLLVVAWLVGRWRSASSAPAPATWNRKFQSAGVPFADAGEQGRNVVGVYGVDWF